MRVCIPFDGTVCGERINRRRRAWDTQIDVNLFPFLLNLWTKGLDDILQSLNDGTAVSGCQHGGLCLRVGAQNLVRCDTGVNHGRKGSHTPHHPRLPLPQQDPEHAVDQLELARLVLKALRQLLKHGLKVRPGILYHPGIPDEL